MWEAKPRVTRRGSEVVAHQTTLACLHLLAWSLEAKLGAWNLSGFPGLWVPVIQLKYRGVHGGEFDAAPKSSTRT